MMLYDTTRLRMAAADILREWREYTPIEPLFLALHDPNARVRSAAQWVIMDVGEYVPPEIWLSHLTDADPIVREAVLYALGTRATINLVQEAIDAPEEGVREAAAYVVSQLQGQFSAESLMGMMQANDARIRAAAIDALGNLGDQIPLEPLLEALYDTDTNVRLAAIRALASSGERMPRTELRALLDDADPSICREATKALASGGDPAALAIIVDWLHADHEWDRENALVWLSRSIGIGVAGNEIASYLPIEELLHLLKDTWWPVGHMAAGMIASLGKNAPIAELITLVSSPLPRARWAALSALAWLGDAIPLSQSIPIEPVLIALEAEDVETRRSAAELLSYFETRVPVDRLLPFLEEDNVEIASIIAKRGRQEGIDILVANLRTRDRANSAAAALGELGKQAPAEALLAALNTSDISVCQSVASVLYKTHPELLSELVPELVETLCTGEVGPLLKPLQEILIAQALAALRHPHPTLLAWFEHALDAPHWEVRMWAIYGLGQMAPHVFEPALEKLQRLLDDPESASVRHVACRVLETLVPATATNDHHQ
ncbi:hypothetical protein KDA_67360 [Dictyobacter alpinus]|uniref:HEAT repeat domain-containing protein n=2 Tax=Dictyobacter alpinus TaxID=2014873 RepID=A0A402BJ38_9CHLR|nr:hypothetical protein KDA_67360 [Dictyobacter alpinus]